MSIPIRWNLEGKICDAYERHGATSSALHGHDHFLITYIVRGEGVQSLNGNDIYFRPGDLFILSPADFHKNTLEYGKSYDYYGVKFKYELLDSRLSDMCALDKFPIHISLSTRGADKIRSAFSHLCEECASVHAGADSEVLMRALIEEIFVYALRELPEGASLQSGSFVNRALGFLHSNFRERITVQDAASYVGYTPNYFNSIFHRTFGEPFGVYLRSMRIAYAKNLLLSGDLPLTVIAIESGFGSLSHFSRVFSASVGISPTEYRKNNSGKQK